jgi:hypothetical protein
LFSGDDDEPTRGIGLDDGPDCLQSDHEFILYRRFILVYAGHHHSVQNQAARPVRLIARISIESIDEMLVP